MSISSVVLELWKFCFYKGLIRNSEIGNTPVWILPNIWRLRQVGIPNLARMSLIKCYCMLQNARVIKGKPAGGDGWGEVKSPPPSPQPRLGLKDKLVFVLLQGFSFETQNSWTILPFEILGLSSHVMYFLNKKSLLRYWDCLSFPNWIGILKLCL